MTLLVPNGRCPPEAGLEVQAEVRPRGLPAHRPVRRIDRGLKGHAQVDQVADQLQVGLDLAERPGPRLKQPIRLLSRMPVSPATTPFPA